MNSINNFIQSYFSECRTPIWTGFYEFFTSFFNFPTNFLLLVIVVSLLTYKFIGRKHLMLFLGSVLSGGFLVYILKHSLNISRPIGGVVEATGQSFPSGHATLSFIFFIMLIYIFEEYIPPIWRNIFNVFCITSALLISFSRIYLGVHWFSDVLAGIVLGLVVSFLSIYIFKYINKGQYVIE